MDLLVEDRKRDWAEVGFPEPAAKVD